MAYRPFQHYPGRLLVALLCAFACAAACGAQTAQAQTSMEDGARTAALGGASTALPGVVWGYGNPATWSTLPGRAVGFFASEAFGLADLRLGAVQVVQPLRVATVAAGARTFGTDDYRETHVGVGAARAFRLGTNRAFHAGLLLRYHALSIPTYGSGGTLAVHLGWMVDVLPTLTLGAQATNLHRPTLAGTDLPRTLSVGLTYAPDPRLLLVGDLFKDVRFPPSVRVGAEVVPLDVLVLRAGATTQPNRFTAGVGVRVGRLRADVAAERHEVLGWSPAVGLGLQW